jgi:hypothetical protein
MIKNESGFFFNVALRNFNITINFIQSCGSVHKFMLQTELNKSVKLIFSTTERRNLIIYGLNLLILCHLNVNFLH